MKTTNRELGTLAAGTVFTYGGNNWIALEHGTDGILCLSEKCICDKAFDKDNNNNWAESSLRKYLNGTYLKKLVAGGASAAAFLPFCVDLAADDGTAEYGTTTDKLALLSCDQYRKFRRAGVLSVLNNWWWTVTPWVASSSYNVRFVNTSGALSLSYANSGSYGVRPLCNLQSSILVSVEEAEGGSNG